MGGGQYSWEEHEAATRARSDQKPEQVFTGKSCDPRMNPKGVVARESRDSAEHPSSRGIVFAFDVSGSMGAIPVELALKTLPSFMRSVTSMIPDPQIMFMAVGNAFEHRSPLQVGQFESEDKLIDMWLQAIHLEGGGEWRGESYDLAMYFAARHTALDCVEKRGQKGYFFMTGDEVWYVHTDKTKVQDVIGDVLENSLPIDNVVDELARTYHPFFLIPDYERAKNDSVEVHWRRLLGDCVIVLQTPDDTAVAAATLIGIREGVLKTPDDIAGKLGKELGMDQATVDRVTVAVKPYLDAVLRGGGGLPTSRAPIIEKPAIKMPG